MHIKQIIIEGFKTYKDRTVIDDLSPGTNAIVGPNGSGKSNVFTAIEFVLSNEFANLSPESRRALLHEGAGLQAATATVEIIFDNTDGRIPVDRKDTVSLKRTMGLKKDEYLLDNKNISRTEVVSLLESAGLSRSNPYYIVQQGKVAKLIKMRDSERLELLMEIAGTRTYDERRAESLRVMTQTDTQRAEVVGVIATIDKRITELDSEKAALRVFQDADSERRAFEHTLLARREAKLASAVASLDSACQAAGAEAAKLHAAAAKASKMRVAAEEELRALSASTATSAGRRQALEAEAKERHVALAQAEAAARAADERARSVEAEVAATAAALSKVRADIAKGRGELAQAQEAAAAADAAEAEARAAAEMLESRKLGLLARQNRGGQFSNKKDRDAHLSSQAKAVEEELAATSAALKDAKKDLAAAEKDLAASERVTKDAPAAAARSEAALTKANADAAGARDALDAAQTARHEAWRAVEAAEARAREAGVAVEKARRDAQVTVERDVFRGLEAVNRIVADKGIEGVYGPLVDLIECDKLFQPCVETVAGGSLFHVVVDSDAVAARLITELNKERAGRVTFMPLSQLRSWPVQYPTRQDCLPMLQRLKFDEKFRPAVAQVFSRTVIVRSLQVGTEVARSHNLDCITASCERVSRRGALTGGFVDTDVSRLRRAAAHRAARAAQAAAEAELARLRSASEAADAAVTHAMSALTKAAQGRAAAADKLRADVALASDAAAEARALSELVATKRAAVTQLEAASALLTERLAAIRAEIKAPYSAELGAADRAALASVTEEAASAKATVEATAATASSARVRVEQLQAHLDNFLMRRAAELQAGEGSALAAVGAAQDAVSLAQADLREAKRAADAAAAQAQALTAEVTRASERLQALQKEADEARDAEAAAAKEATDATQSSGQALGRAAMLERQLADTRRDMQALGSIPTAVLDKAGKLGMAELEAGLQKALAVVNKHAGVNKRAVEQSASLKQQREELVSRKTELDQGRASIVELIESLDLKKDEAIDRTFKAIGHQFSQVFSELVPGGKGTLVLHTRGGGAGRDLAGGADSDADDDNDNDDDDEEAAAAAEEAKGSSTKAGKKRAAAAAGAASPAPKRRGGAAAPSSPARAAAAAAADPMSAKIAALSGAAATAARYSGVGIRVAFSGQRQQATGLLSGGQQCVVALSLIFAIQRCDPSPFYVFDEIDANLDAVHRTAVASVIAAQKAATQFIVTTFRPEFLNAMDKFIGVRFSNKTSTVREISKQEARALVSSGSAASHAGGR